MGERLGQGKSDYTLHLKKWKLENGQVRQQVVIGLKALPLGGHLICLFQLFGAGGRNTHV